MERLGPERDLSEGKSGLRKDSAPRLVRPRTAQLMTHAIVDKIGMSGHNGRWGPGDLYVTLEREEKVSPNHGDWISCLPIKMRLLNLL